MFELAGIIILGMLAQWVAWRVKIPAILPLILTGLLVGPVAAEFLSENGSKWIEPIWNGEKGLFPGDGLYYFVSLAISIILFEGGLTLKRSEIKTVGTIITKLITIGSAITFLGAGVIAHAIFKLSWEMSFLFSGLIIVTGPTVINPILRNIPLKKDISTVLKWEGILIDPIGALIAVLVFEFISVEGASGFTKTAFIEFAKIIIFGTLFGFSFAKALAICVNKKLVPHYLLNVVSLSVVLLVFVAADFFAHESGLLAVVVMGMVLGNSKLENIKELLYFKESLSVLLISILFILLAANINIEDLLLIYTWKTILLFATIVFVIRPLGVFICTANSTLKFNEKLFISWVGPRGIVAAGIASLFGSKLIKKGIEGAEYITPLVFMVVLGTVLLNATTARFFAKIAGVFLQKSEGILIVGASNISRLLATYLKKNNRHVVLIDSNQTNIEEAKKLDLEAMHTDIYSDDLMDNIELNDIGFLMALTGNSDINQYAIKKFKKQFGENGSFRLVTAEEFNKNKKNPKEGLLFDTDNYNSILELTFRHPSIHEVDLKDKTHYEDLIEIAKKDLDIIPLFIKDKKGTLHIISSRNLKTETIKSGFKFVYMGKPIDSKI
jgi:NhaP-type Na+/H+ or K+/H+ antiporter